MNLLFKVLLISFMVAFAQAKPENDVCLSSEMLRKTELSCIQCGLKKAGRPMPDDNFLGAMGLLVRENMTLHEKDKAPYYKKDRTNTLVNVRMGLHDTFTDKNSIVQWSTKGEMQRKTIQMLLASGYCGQGRIKTKNQKSNYSNFIKRVQSRGYAVTGDDKDERTDAVKELGFGSWSNTNSELFTGFPFGQSFDEQKAFYARKRTSAISRGEDSFQSSSDITGCLKDIDSTYKENFEQNASYKACTSMYNECGIATHPEDGGVNAGKMFNKDGTRVGGDWCSKLIYGTDIPPTPQPALATNQVTKPNEVPVEDKSSYSLGTVYRRGDKVYGEGGAEIDVSKIQVQPNGDLVIPRGAIKYPLVQPQPAPAAGSVR